MAHCLGRLLVRSAAKPCGMLSWPSPQPFVNGTFLCPRSCGRWGLRVTYGAHYCPERSNDSESGLRREGGAVMPGSPDHVSRRGSHGGDAASRLFAGRCWLWRRCCRYGSSVTRMTLRPIARSACPKDIYGRSFRGWPAVSRSIAKSVVWGGITESGGMSGFSKMYHLSNRCVRYMQ
jgi:hypothetical protein